jgi:hypothetical protein
MRIRGDGQKKLVLRRSTFMVPLPGMYDLWKRLR